MLKHPLPSRWTVDDSRIIQGESAMGFQFLMNIYRYFQNLWVLFFEFFPFFIENTKIVFSRNLGDNGHPSRIGSPGQFLRLIGASEVSFHALSIEP
jgi:hypothetical protein